MRSGTTTLYPDTYIEHFGELFVRRRVRQRLHVSFEQFLVQPRQMLARIDKIEGRGYPTQADLCLAQQEQAEAAVPSAFLRNGNLLEPIPRAPRLRRPWFFRRRRHV